ncbi:MAG: glycosyltransferase [Acidocella sp.]|nr:glycosyltransferase [Acidocella sp.]
MKIAQIMAGAANGGAELFYERMTIGLAAAGQEVLPIIRGHANRIARLQASGLTPVTARFGGPLDIFTRPKIRNALQNFKADIAIAWMSRAAAFLPKGDWVTAGRLGGYYDLKYFRACEHLIGNTRGITNWIIDQGVAASNVHYLPNFVDDFAAADPASRADIGVPEDAKLMLGLGRLHPVKGFDILIKAAASLPDVYCVIAGEGPERARLDSLINQLGVAERVKLLGWRNDSGALLKAADIFVSSSRHEPLGNMVLEAFAAQTPVLAAKSEGPGEVIRNGTDGILVPIDDAAALADAAKTMLSDVRLRMKLALGGRQRFVNEFSQATVTAAWLEFLHKVKR